MATSSAPTDLIPFAPRTPHIIGREKYIEAIWQAIADKDHSYVLYFVGPGGIGKTRLLEEVKTIQEEWANSPFGWSGIIDLYHTEFHSPSGLRNAIADGLDQENRYFQTYRKLRLEFEQKRSEGMVGPELEQRRRHLDIQFRQDYEALANEQRLVLCFDTLELIQYESDRVQTICQVEDVETVIKNWLLEQVSHLPNTVTLFAGRERQRVQADFEQGFTKAGWKFELFKLKALTEPETQHYLKVVGEQRSELAEILQLEVQKRIYAITQGRPIYLSLLIDLMLYGKPLNKIFPTSEVKVQNIDEKLVGQRFVQHLQEDLEAPFDRMVYFLVHARKGLDIELLHHLVGDDWTAAQIQANLDYMRQFAFIKTRPDTKQIFLHDEVYDLFDHYFVDDPRYGSEFTSIAQYYRQRRETANSPREREALTVTLLYYELMINAYAGYHKHYTRWDEEAIKSHEAGYDMRLRDEVLRFLDRYTKLESPFYNQTIANRVDTTAIDRDCAVRWLNRYVLTRREYHKAIQVAKNLRHSNDPAFNWAMVNDPLYQAGLLTAWGEAMLYTNAPEREVLDTLEQAVQLLQVDRAWDEDQQWWQARILGRAHNNIGYLHRTRGRYGLALEQYQRALPYFSAEETDIPDERALTLNNLAFLLALLGRVRQARRYIEQALQIRRQIGRRYPLALSHNTRGFIYTLEDHPDWGVPECREALRICEELQETRGIGLACIFLGFTLRKWGDQWKLKTLSQEESEQWFEEAIQHLQRAADIFADEVREPIRLWEAYNELGSLYCDWGWLARFRQNGHRTGLEQAALKQYEQSVGYQKKALEIAQKHDLQFQIADSYDDLAQVYGDQSFLFIQMGQVKAAQQSRETAESYLKQIEAMIPQTFHLVSNVGFVEAPEPGEAYWLSLGKANLWRGIWAFRDLEAGPILDQERQDMIQQATRQLILAVIYFQRFWPGSYALEHTLDYISNFLVAVGVSANWAYEQVSSIANEYKVKLEVIEEIIEETLGYNIRR